MPYRIIGGPEVAPYSELGSSAGRATLTLHLCASSINLKASCVLRSASLSSFIRYVANVRSGTSWFKDDCKRSDRGHECGGVAKNVRSVE